MALIGKFSETPFTDLIQFYTASRQTVAVTVSLPDGPGGGESEDGVFYIEDGDVVDAWLGDAVGRDAIRRALRMSGGSFRVEPNIRTAERTVSEPWRQLLLEELVYLDEERRPGRKPPPPSAPTPAPAKPAAATPPRLQPVASGTSSPPKLQPVTSGTPTPPKLQPVASGTPNPSRLEPATSGTPAPSRLEPATSETPLPVQAAPAEAAPAPASPAGERKGMSPAVLGGIAAAVVAAAVVAVLATRSGSKEAPPSKAPASAAQPAAEAAATAGKASTAVVPTLTFGMASPLYGADLELGRGMKVGIELAFAAANEAGGIHGKRLALVALDDGNEPARTADVMRELLETRKVFAIVGNAGTATAAAALPAVLDKKVPFVGALGGAALRKEPPDRYVFVYRPSISEETAAAVRYLVDVRRLEPADIAVFVQDDEFGQAGWAGAAQQLKAYGRDPEKALRVTYRRNSADVDDAVKKLRAAKGVKAVVMAATHGPGARLIERIAASAPGTVFTNVSSVDVAQFADDLAGAKVPLASDNVVVTQVVPLPSSRATAVIRYRNMLQKYASTESPGALSLEGWVVGTLLVEALKGAGPNPEPEKLVEALEALHGLDIGIGGPLGFSRTDHQASHKVWGTALDPSGTWRQIDLQ
jgi:ABC-type branched-subunit amino acid transport system substrate-binding protein